MNIKELMERRNVTRKQLVERFGIPYRTIQDWCLGHASPPDYVIRMMDELLKEDEIVGRGIYREK